MDYCETSGSMGLSYSWQEKHYWYWINGYITCRKKKKGCNWGNIEVMVEIQVLKKCTSYLPKALGFDTSRFVVKSFWV